MKRNVLAILLSALAAAVLSSCGNTTPSSVPDTPPESAAVSSVPSEAESPQPESQPAAAVVEVTLTEGSVPEDPFFPRVYTEEDYAESDYLVFLDFKTDHPVTDLQFFEITFPDEFTEEVTFKIGSVLYRQKELSPELGCSIGTSFPGDSPTRGFSYMDGDGTIQYRYVTLSGKDGSLIVDIFRPV